MSSPRQYYPEFDSAEVAQTIAPLDRFDAEVLGGLSVDVPGSTPRETPIAGTPARHARDVTSTSGGTPDPTSVPDGATDVIADWTAAEETYPFQQVVRAAALSVLDPTSRVACDQVAHDPAALTVQLLERAEMRLRDLWIRPLVASVNQARTLGRLSGETPQERYTDFCRSAATLGADAVSGLTFPVLDDVTRVVLRQEREAFVELATRLAADRDVLAEQFGLAQDDRLVSLGAPAGDTHNHGRSVSVLTFASGLRLVYKPRDVSCEAAWADAVPDLDDFLGTRLLAPRVLRRDGYGYVSFVEAEEVDDLAAPFMRASGELAAVFYLLNARDMHFENVLPTRAGPLPIDLETILHPDRVHTGPTPQAPGNAYSWIAGSIYGIGILPLVMVGRDPSAGHVDLGFLGDQGRGAAPFKALHFEDPFTDEVRAALRTVDAGVRATVVGSGGRQRMHDLGLQVAEGFSRVLSVVRADPDRWTALVRRHFGAVRVRYVHNPTQLYAQTLRMTSGPSALDDPQAYLGLLKRIAIASKTSDPAIVAAELRQLAVRDVPYFTVDADDVELRTGDGVAVGARVEAGPLQVALDKVGRLDDVELAEQLRLIHSAFASRFPDNHLDPDASLPGSSPGWVSGGVTDADVVTRLCDELVATARPDHFAHLPRTWIGPLASAEVNRPWPPGVLGYDLYTGRVGPALALAAASTVLDRPDWRDLAVDVFAPTADILARRRYERRSIQQAGFGLHTGLTGTLVALAMAGDVLGEPGWSDAARDGLPLVLEQLAEIPAETMPLDVVTGLAGVLAGVIALEGGHGGAPRQAVRDLTGLLVRALGDAARGPGPASSVLEQSGYAHGVAGALGVLGRSLPLLDADSREAAERTCAALLARLDTFHDPHQGGWRSTSAPGASAATGWCHGAAGIGLALQQYRDGGGRVDVSARLAAAVESTFAVGFGRNLTWCHGDLGNHSVMSAVAAGRPDLRGRLTEVERRWLRPEVMVAKLDDVASRYSHSSSLMVGSAGVVLHLVGRLAGGAVDAAGLRRLPCPVSLTRSGSTGSGSTGSGSSTSQEA